MTSQREALLLVDLQNAFFDDPGLAERKDEVISAANRLADAAHDAGIPIFVITTVHSRDRSTWTLNMLEIGEGFLFDGEEGTEVVAELNTSETTRIEKTRDSAWFATDLHLRLTNLHITRIILAGVSTHGCIAQTTRDAYAHNMRATIVTDAVADARTEQHRAQVAQLEQDGQATLATVDEIITAWQTN
ncbi:MAG TPA: cysteine hydrolase [Candidatus Yaniella excrementigallinarum]|nr:cysteine hydrolase [Candidatus Yaniella excrementigallinarum]